MSTTKGSLWKRKLNNRTSNSSSSNKKKIINVFAADEERNIELLSFDRLPDYMKDNEYILDYYRSNWPIKQALFSLFSWHNETLNVWTHLLGFLLFVGLTVANVVDVPQMADLITLFTEQYPSTPESNVSTLAPTNKILLDLNQESTTSERLSPFETTTATNWPFYVFLSGSMFCLLSSSVCHLFSCHSHRLNLHLLHIDYVGITVMIITSFFPPIYYVFNCSPLSRLVYLTTITVMGACTIVALLSPALSSGKFRSLRAMLFVCMGLFGLIPAAHALMLNWEDPRRNVTLAYESGMGLSYLIGAGFYVSRIPERWRPGWFDLAGHSHQIFHVLVVVGALAHYGAARNFLSSRSGVTC